MRNKQAVDERVKAELNRDNIHIVEGDLTDYTSIEVRKFLFPFKRSVLKYIDLESSRYHLANYGWEPGLSDCECSAYLAPFVLLLQRWEPASTGRMNFLDALHNANTE